MSKSINDIFFSDVKTNPYTNVYGLARTILAIGSLLTLVFNHTNVLFAAGAGINPPVCLDHNSFSIYCLLSNHLELARAISIVILVVVASGWRPRFTCVMHWWVTFSLNSTALVLEGGDQVATVLTLMLIPFCLGDSRKWHWQSEMMTHRAHGLKEILLFLSVSTYLIIRLQVALIYFDASVQKFDNEEWINGTAVYYWFTDPYMGAPSSLRLILLPFITNTYITPLITWGVLVFEIWLFTGIAVSVKQRRIMLLCGIFFHLAIAFIHGLFPFFCSMTAALILYLQPFDQKFELKAIPKPTFAKLKWYLTAKV